MTSGAWSQTDPFQKQPEEVVKLSQSWDVLNCKLRVSKSIAYAEEKAPVSWCRIHYPLSLALAATSSCTSGEWSQRWWELVTNSSRR